MSAFRHWALLLVSCFVLTAGCASTRVVGGQRVSLAIDDSDVNWSLTYRVDVVCKGSRSGLCMGTAVLIHRSGVLLTNAHVVRGTDPENVSDRITVAIQETDGVVHYEAKVVMYDPVLDVAAIKIDRSFPRAATLLSSEDFREEVAALHEVYTIGYPLALGKAGFIGGIANLHFSDSDAPPGSLLLPEHAFDTETAAHVPARRIVIQDELLLDIFGGPGSSGSGVFRRNGGELIGLIKVFAKPSKDGPQYLMIAVPVTHILPKLDAAKVPYGDD